MKLTLAPLAALDVLDVVDRILDEPQMPQPPSKGTNEPTPVAPERWRTIELRNWADFATAWHLPE